jgi:hypothetical protein
VIAGHRRIVRSAQPAAADTRPRARCPALPERTIRGSPAALSAAAPDQLWKSSIPEEIGGLALASARSMRATPPGCLLLCARQAIGKHLRDRGAGAGVAPEFMPKQNSALVAQRLDVERRAASRGESQGRALRRPRAVLFARRAISRFADRSSQAPRCASSCRPSVGKAPGLWVGRHADVRIAYFTMSVAEERGPLDSEFGRRREETRRRASR